MACAPIRDADLERVFSEDGHLADHLDSFVRAVEARMDGWLHRFQWDKQVLLDRHREAYEDESSAPASVLALRTCPFDSAHAKIKQANLASHVERCRLKSLGLTADDIVRAIQLIRLLLVPTLVLTLVPTLSLTCSSNTRSSHLGRRVIQRSRSRWEKSQTS